MSFNIPNSELTSGLSFVNYSSWLRRLSFFSVNSHYSSTDVQFYVYKFYK